MTPDPFAVTPEDFEGILAIIFTLSIPIVAIICFAIVSIRKKNRETELRKAIIENHVDAESIKLLIEEPEKKNKNKKSEIYNMLRVGCMLLGGGLGAFVSQLFIEGDPQNSLYFWLFIGCGIGIGMLISFVIEYKLTKREQEQQASEQETALVS